MISTSWSFGSSILIKYGQSLHLFDVLLAPSCVSKQCRPSSQAVSRCVPGEAGGRQMCRGVAPTSNVSSCLQGRQVKEFKGKPKTGAGFYAFTVEIIGVQLQWLVWPVLLLRNTVDSNGPIPSSAGQSSAEVMLRNHHLIQVC